MIVSLVPLLLAANITADKGDWKYGPEVIYDAKIDSLISPHEELEKTFNVTAKLKCRPKTELVLSCQLYEPSISDKSEAIDESWKLDKKYQSGPFELNFDGDGLKEIVVPSSVDPIVWDAFKDLAKQLDFGVDLSTIPLSVFDIMENSTTGRCKTNYFMSNDRFDGADRNGKIQVVLQPTMRVPWRTVMNVKKTRYMDQCLYRYNYYDSNWKEIGRALNGRKDLAKYFYETELKSSKSYMTITANTFSSHTEEVMIITKDGDKSTAAERREKITVNLTDIVPANDPLQNIDDPITLSIFSIESLRSDGS